jgi:carboxylesterase
MEPTLPQEIRSLIENEQCLFEDEYRQYFTPGETKGPEIGSPVFLDPGGPCTAVLLIHGFMAAPEEVRPWAENLYSRGYRVYAPRLAGHGTSAEDLATRNTGDWIESVERGYRILAGCSSKIVVAGFSTGAGLALDQAIRHPERYRAVVSVSAPMKFASLSSSFSRILEGWNNTARSLKLESLRKNFARNHPDNPEINYTRCPIHGFNQVKALMRRVNLGLPGLSVPALIIQGTGDPKVSPGAGRMIFDRIGCPRKQYVPVDFHQHGIVRGEVGVAVYDAVHRFLSEYLA